MEFGTEQRQDTLGNAIPEISPPALRVTPRDEVTQRTAKSTGLEEGFASLGKGLGDAFQQFMDDKANTIAEQKKQETIARQGLDVAVNKEDAKLKRTGWGLALYGQNPNYALAETMAVEQRVKQRAMLLNADIDNYATVHPAEFRDRVLKDELGEILKGYEDDPEIRTKLSTVWFDRVQGVVDNQYKAWFANSQKQIFDRAVADILIGADEWQQNLNRGLDTGDADLIAKTVSDASKLLQHRGDELGQHPTAWRRAKLNATQMSLAEGNKNLYDLMKKTGELEDLTLQESRGINTAISAYDTKFRASVDATWTDFETDLRYTDNLEEGLGKITEFLGELKAAESRASGTEHSQLTIQRGERNAAIWHKRLRKEMEKQVQGLSQREVKADQFEDLVNSFNIRNPLDRYSTQSQNIYTDTERETAFDEYIKRTIEGLGVDVSDEGLIGAQIIRNPPIAEALGKRLANEPIKSKLMTNLIGAFANGWQNMFDANGKLSQDGGLMLQSVERLRANGVIGKYLNTQEAKDLEFVTTRIMRGQPAASIETDFSNWKRTRENIVSGAPKQKNQTQAQADLEHVNSIARSVYGQDLDTQSRFEVRDMYMEGLGIYDNDHKKASDYVRTRLEQDAAVVNGQIVPGSKNINSFPVQTTDRFGKATTETLNLEAVLNGAGDRLLPYLAAAKGLSAEEYKEKYAGTKFSDQSIRLVTEFGYDGVILDAADGIQAMPIPRETLQAIAEHVYKQKQIADDVKARQNIDINMDMDDMWNQIGGTPFAY